MATWRERATPLIAEVLAETKGQTEKEIKHALYEAYPFGPREYYPYKIWCDEIRRQRGMKRLQLQKRKPEVFPYVDPNQQELPWE